MQHWSKSCSSSPNDIFHYSKEAMPMRTCRAIRDDARAELLGYLEAELIGPVGGSEETVVDQPHRRYVSAVLYPQKTTTIEMTTEEEAEGPGGSAKDDTPDDPVTLSNSWMPSSAAISFFVSSSQISCRPWGAAYEEIEPRKKWQRVPLAEHDDKTGAVNLTTASPEATVLHGRGVLVSKWRPLGDGHLVTVSLINTAVSEDPNKVDPCLCLYQVGFECTPVDGEILEYPRVDALTRDKEEEELRVLYRRIRTFAVGHGCSAEWPDEFAEKAGLVRTQFMPFYEVAAVSAVDTDGQPVLEIGRLADPAVPRETLITELNAFVGRYRNWIETLRSAHPDIPGAYEDAATRILERLRSAAERMDAGVELLASGDHELEAFRWANLAVAIQMRRGKPDLGGTRRVRDTLDEPTLDYLNAGYRWRPFQLAFQLLTLPSIANEDEEDRDIVDLLWFPTGGGKTEAYLALAAFQIFLRRLRHGERGAGTTVITRYTLRLLTSQQFQRAGGVICAAEWIRRQHRDQLGESMITIGLWVGDEASPNKFQTAQERFNAARQDPRPTTPFQVERCPWCGTELMPEEREDDDAAYGVDAGNTYFRLFCPSVACEFHERLPISMVDEDLFLNPPTLLIATVDKFARLAWEERGAAFFCGTATLPPSLIIQDELHLLSGPLGTTVGLYEAAIEALISLKGARPKVIASTATIRRADEQTLGLFARHVRVFPPPGLDAADSFYARVDRTTPGRLYVGVTSPSHTVSTAIVHTAAALLEGVQTATLAPDELDAYWTLVMYHNSLRELGRSVTLARDDIPSRIRVITRDEATMRALGDDEVVELTSNVPGYELRPILSRMEDSFSTGSAISVLASTNMLSVGVDVPRLGLMFVIGQPKTTSEYIQATSRVGRSAVPGLVVTLFTATKPRDRSHYESFLPYHASLYRNVEPTSVTPFALPSRARALHAALVILVRHGTELASNDAASRFEPDDPAVVAAIAALIDRVREVDPYEAPATEQQLYRLADEWKDAAQRARADNQVLHYRGATRQIPSLLRDFGAEGSGWDTLHSMRSVDRQCTVEVMGEGR
jgi:hypothetical protein